MRLLAAILLLTVFFQQCLGEDATTGLPERYPKKAKQHSRGVTKILPGFPLYRTKRYLTFPSGSSFILTISLIKSLMLKSKPLLRLAGECDVPFSLPSDTRWLKHRGGNRRRQRREVMEQLSAAIDGLGFNGTACIQRTICDVRSYIPYKGTSLVKDLLLATFKFDEQDCDPDSYSSCELPLLSYLEGLTGLDVENSFKNYG